MKKLIFLAFLAIEFCGNAQHPNIPDANFKNALPNHNPIIDTNGGGEIQISENQANTPISGKMVKGIYIITATTKTGKSINQKIVKQ